MGTANWDRAQRWLEKLIDPDVPPPGMPVAEAAENYLSDCRTRGLAASTVRSYKKTLDHLVTFCTREFYLTLERLTLETLTAFRTSRRGRNIDESACASTLRKELECLRAFCAFAVDRGWMGENVAKKMRPPKETVTPTVPFEPAEVQAIVAASNKFGARARAFVLLLLHSGLRISDAAKLERSALRVSGHLRLRQMKTGAALHVRLPQSIARDLLSLERKNEKYFFWNSSSKLSTLVGNFRRTIGRILKLANVSDGHPHRFRDTFAVQLLQQDVPIRTVQLLLGHTSVRTTEKHYAPFVQSQQRLLDEAVAKLDYLLPEQADQAVADAPAGEQLGLKPELATAEKEKCAASLVRAPVVPEQTEVGGLAQQS